MKYISVDTEYSNKYIPFIATTTDEQMKSRLYILSNKKDYRDLKAICENSSISKVFHAATNDIYALQNIGINTVPPYDDTCIAARLVNENFQAAGLKPLVKEILNEPCEEEKLLSKVKSKYKKIAKQEGKIFSYDQIPKEVLYPYAIKDTEYTMKLWYYFMKPLKKYRKIYRIEKELIPIIVEMVANGFRVDRKFVKQQIKQLKSNRKIILVKLDNILKDNKIKFKKELIRKREPSIYSYCEKHKLNLKKIKFDSKNNQYIGIIYEKANLGSPIHLIHIIQCLDIPIKETTEKLKLATDIETLRNYIQYPFIKLLIESRFIEKQLSTYYEPLIKEYTTKEDPIAHFMFYQSGAKTGRFTANLIQTMPKM